MSPFLTLMLAQNDAPPAVPGAPAPAGTPGAPGSPVIGPGGTATTSTPSGSYPSAHPQQPDGPNYMLFLMVGALVLMFGYTFWSQSKKDKAREKTVSALKKGDRVYTYGGMIGTIHEVDGAEVVIKGEDNQKIRVTKAAVVGPYEAGKTTPAP